ncbi:hypothetical protein BDD12DRAFT_898322 [Trichophaea hybrida]|nr:hypothetical protein BDD12DRAFT_898322 [Trichophaea hybrida]
MFPDGRCQAREEIASSWFPEMPSKNLQQMSLIEENIRFVDNSATYERADFWRAYTTSLLFQNTQVQSRLNAVKMPAIELSRLLSKVQMTPRIVPETPLRDLLLSVMHLAAQLRCQRGIYEVDNSICLGDYYDDDRMIDLENPDLKETNDSRYAHVRAVVSNGVVWKSFTGPGAVVERICKARVLVVTCTGEGGGKEIAVVPPKEEGHCNEIIVLTGK